MDKALDLLAGLPPSLFYPVLAAGAVVENILPVVPADTFIVVGGFIAGLGRVAVLPVFVVVWLFNVAGAVGVYLLGLRYGRDFFHARAGRHLVSKRGMRRMESFYERWGVAAIFVARFLPGFRALVPVFAGVAGLGAIRVVPPLLVASAIWYGVLVRIGYLAGDNLEAVRDALARTNRGLLAVSAVLAVALATGWWRHARRTGTPQNRTDEGRGTSVPPAPAGSAPVAREPFDEG